MKLSTSRFCLALLVVGLTATCRAQEQQLCPDMTELFSNPDYQATTCLFQDFPDDCGNCGNPTPTINYVPGGVSCDQMEEELCPAIRCCENCWEKLQNYNQCFMVEPNWMSKGGLVEDGCVLDCSRFPIGGGDDPVDSPPVQPDVDTTNTESTNSGIYIQDEELIENCRGARNNMMCQIENCQQCGDDGYPSVEVTQLKGIEEVGSFYDCGQMEEAVCPEIRCCESCDYKLSEFWFQCNVVESAKELGRTDFSCSIDCSSYKSGISMATTSEDSADATNNGDEVETEEDDGGILDTIGDMVDSIFGSPAPTVTTSMLSWNIGMLVLVGALARV